MTEAMLHSLFKHLPAVCMVCKLAPAGEEGSNELIFLEGNQAFEQMTGLRAAELAGNRVEEVFKEDPEWKDVFRRIALECRDAQEEFRTRIGGSWYRVSSLRLEREHIVILLHNVSHEVKNLEELTRKKEEVETLSAELKIIFNSTHDAMFLVSCEGDRFVYLRNNRTHQEQTGYDLMDIAGRTPEEVLEPETAAAVMEGYRLCVQTGAGITREETLKFRGGARDWLLSLVPVWSNGEIRYLVGSRTDITEVKRLQRDQEGLNRRLKAMFNGHAAVMLFIDSETGKILNANPAACDFYGYTREELLSLYIQEINMLPDQKVENLRRAAEKGKTGYFLTSHKLKSGEIRMVDVFSCPVSEDGHSELFSIIVDVTERENYRKAIREEKELLNVTLRSIGDGVLTTDNQGVITSLNKAATEITGWGEEEARGRLFTEVMQLKNEETGLEVENPIRLVLDSGKIVGLANHTVLIQKAGGAVPIADSAAPIRNAAGDKFGVVMVFRDVGREKQQQDRIRYLSYHDALTGLYNRCFLEEKVREMDTASYLPLAVIMGDVNGLKVTNDVFGHEAGDKLLTEVAETLKENCSSGDVLARWGGDEFLILMPRTSKTQGEKFIRQVKGRFAEKRVGNLQLSVSLGCSAKIRERESFQRVLREAEERMYHQKLLESPSYRSSIVSTLLETLYEKSMETEEHGRRLKVYCIAIGESLKLTSEELKDLGLLAILHDIGKVGIHQSILSKPGPLTPEETEEMRRHAEIGYRIAQSSPELSGVAEYILSHHERWDGQGYPRKLKGEEIPVYSRILAVADAFDAMVSDRPYRGALPRKEAVRELEHNAGRQFDPRMVAIFLNLFRSEDPEYGLLPL